MPEFVATPQSRRTSAAALLSPGVCMQSDLRTSFWHNADLLKILTGETISDFGSPQEG